MLYQRKPGYLRTLPKNWAGGKTRRHPLYNRWKTMLSRCFNKNVKNYGRYGGRGITVCNEWRNDFNAFAKFAFNHGWRVDLTIDRVNNDGNYEPSNVRFVTPRENSKNRVPTEKVMAQAKILSHWKDKPVECIDTGKIYKSAREASRDNGFSDDAVSYAILYRKGKLGGIYFKYIKSKSHVIVTQEIFGNA